MIHTHTRWPFRGLVLSCLLLTLGCAYGDNSDSACIVEGSPEGFILVSVSGCGDQPFYSWGDGEGVFEVRVERTAGNQLAWSVVSDSGQDNIFPSVRHGGPPSGTTPSGTETQLTTGVEYRVAVSRQTGGASGSRKFTIQP